VDLPVNRLRLKDPITAGMDPYILLGMVADLRKTARHLPPIDVDDECSSCGTSTVLDGRHRFFANVIAGRWTVKADPRRG
jgi:hypothetical protein